MGSKGTSVGASTYVVVALLCLNLVSFTMVSSQIITLPTPSQNSTCNPLRLDVCATLLSGLVNATVGTPTTPTGPCCSLLASVANLNAAVCLCTAIKANVLGVINVNATVAVSALLNYCERNNGTEYQCR